MASKNYDFNFLIKIKHYGRCSLVSPAGRILRVFWQSVWKYKCAKNILSFCPSASTRHRQKYWAVVY